MQIIDLRRAIDGNIILHVLAQDISELKPQKSKFHRTSITRLTLSDGTFGAIFPKARKDGYGDYEFVFTGSGAATKCVASPLITTRRVKHLHKRIADTWSTDIPLIGGSNALRDAQKGAIFSLFGHWTSSREIATVVMPTGTGKTEALLAIIAAKKASSTIIVVPTDSLRQQVFNKAATWGKLRELKVINAIAANPCVGLMRASFSSEKLLKDFVNSSQIIVTTMQILNNAPPAHLKILGESCELFAVDEAHHVAAPTWSRIVDAFKHLPIVQFTATPFRQDGKHIPGQIIYSFPLAKCQADGYFKPINFIGISEFSELKSDEAICDRALVALKTDTKNRLNHALMARTKSKERAKTLLTLYQRKCPEFKPVLIYSGMNSTDKNAAKAMLLSGKSKIIICVDMLGEGFDYPNLKIAAIHDAHRTLPVTLQFIGRFTRDGDGKIGDATVIANIADPGIRSNISALYSQDADWNHLIRGSYEDSIGHEIKFQDFINNFRFDGIGGFSVRNVKPKFSTYMYDAPGAVDLNNLKEEYNDGEIYRMAVNQKDCIAVVVQKELARIDWGNIRDLVNINYHCFVLFHDDERKLLFVFTSNSEMPDEIASRVSATVTRIADRRINRCMHGINRLMLTSVGLKKRLVGPIRYRQYMGLDVAEGLRERLTENTYLAMLFGDGYENGERTNVGCSQKGKIWSRDGGDLVQWTEWCRYIGGKVRNDSVNVDDLVSGVLFPEQLKAFDLAHCIVAMDWSEYVFETIYDKITIQNGKDVYEIFECELKPVSTFLDTTSIQFSVKHEHWMVNYVLKLTSDRPEGFVIKCLDKDLIIESGRDTLSGVDFFHKHPPLFWLDNTALIVEGCLQVKSNRSADLTLFDPTRVLTKNWHGVNIKVESQGVAKRSDSIQYSTIEHLKFENPIFIFDDDGAGEIADIVCAFDMSDHVVVRLYHCKYSSEVAPGLRVKDIYELAGQAQKSVKWAGSLPMLIEHIRHRESLRVHASHPTRFQKNDATSLVTLKSLSLQKRIRYEVVLVQPGLSKQQLLNGSEGARGILRILGSVASYLSETFEIKLEIVTSD